MAACWLLFPLLMCLVCLGCGLLLDVVSGTRMPRPLLLPAGLALVVVLAQLAVSNSVTVSLALPLVLVATVAGLVLGRAWRLRPGAGFGWAAAASVGVFAVYAAPIVLSGQATFAGYIKLDDTATWLALTDHALAHGSSLSHLPASTYGATLHSYLSTGYPLGSFLPLGLGHKLTGQDIAWLFQPYMAFMAAMLALTLYWLASRALGSRAFAALCAFAAAQAATLYGYSLWGGVKEVAAAWLVAITAALAIDAALEARMGRALLPVAVAFAAGLSALSIGGAVWLSPALFGALVVAVHMQRREVPVRQALVFVPAAAVLAAPAIAAARTFLHPAAGTLTSDTELGNLRQPLKVSQVLGIWPAPDFRGPTVHPSVTTILLAVLCVLAAAAVYVAISRESWELPLFVLATGLACVLVVTVGSPWVDGKAYATASPAFVLAAMVGAGFLFVRRGWAWRGLGGALALVLLGGVLWSNALAYRNVDLAPRKQLGELEQIGKRFAGQGPALMNDYEPYGARHFLRSLDAESASELRVHVIPMRDGTQVPKGSSADLDRFAPSTLMGYRTIVLHRAPSESRPPAPYSLVWRGRYWDVWQRPATPQRAVVADLPLGSGLEPGDVPGCASVQKLAREVPAGGELAAAPRVAPVEVQFTDAHVPPGWFIDPAHAGALEPVGAGAVNGRAIVPRDTTYGIWLGGTFKSGLRVFVDGKPVASARGVLEWEPFVRVGQVRLSAGTVHQVRIVYDAPSLLHAGSGGFESGFGPLVLSDESGREPVTFLPPARARSLCGRYLDWVEALGPKVRTR